jgi:hypothetical protein
MPKSRTPAKSRKPAPSQAEGPPPPKRVRKTRATIRRALDELDINVPWYHCRVVGNRLEFHLYGGQVVYWPKAASEAKQPQEEP